MQAPQQSPQTPALISLFPAAIQWFIQALGLAAILLVITQNVDLDFSAKEVHTKMHYKGNVLMDLKRQSEK